ncbi:MAG: hypothetical protein ABSA51_04340 [Anaerolineaceae bacterium]|jgi:hypothetical protein
MKVSGFFHQFQTNFPNTLDNAEKTSRIAPIYLQETLLISNFLFLMLVVLIGILMYIYAGSNQRWDGQQKVSEAEK